MSQNSNLIIKNGVYLFIRLLLVLFLGFFATRLALQVLGDEQYGIYNIVGGIIAIFAIISMPIRDSLQRFFNVEFVQNRLSPDVIIFTSVKIVTWMILLITILYESAGLYLINYVIKYPVEEQISVNIVFQISILSNVFGFAALPYLSLLFAKENMGVPAICEIVGSVLKVFLLYMIPYIPITSLVSYATIFLIINWLSFIFYKKYCQKCYSNCFSSAKQNDKALMKNMLSFSGWSFVESIAGIALTYVSNILLNIFGGVLYNTAYGVSKQLHNAIINFSSNVLKAASPQITSNTATDNDVYRNRLVMSTSKISFLLCSFAYIVFHFDGVFFLDIWLDTVPEFAVQFCDLAILSTVFTSISLPYRTLIMATGNVRGYFLTYGAISFISILIMYYFLKSGAPMISVMYILTIVAIIMWGVAIMFAVRMTSMRLIDIILDFTLQLVVVIITTIVYIFVRNYVSENIMGVGLSILISFSVFVIMTYLIALNRSEKNKIEQLIKKII